MERGKHILTNDRRCKYCNALMPTYARFCSNCGKRFDRSIKAHFSVSLLRNVAGVLLPLCAILLWSLSLPSVNVRHMTDLGLVSVLPASTIIAFAIMTISFCLVLQRSQLQVPIILLHLLLLIFMLYGITTLVEEVPRFAVVYRLAGITEYIMRTGSVNPNLDAYFSWPIFFVLSAFVAQIAGYHSIFPFATWAPVYLNLLYLGPLYIIFTSATTNNRVVWLGLLFFYLTDWIWQDYYSPQAVNFFLYLVFFAILLKWFKVTMQVKLPIGKQRLQHLGRFTPLAQRLYTWLSAPNALCTPSQPRRRALLLVILLIVFAADVSSHPLTPFFILTSATILVIFGRTTTPRWLPIFMAIMIAAWLFFMTRAFLVGHLDALTGSLGDIFSTVSVNMTSRVVVGYPGHAFINDMRIIMTMFTWVLAFAGAVYRLRRGYRDVTYILLTIAPFFLIIANSYGGEMVLRIYLFALPFVVFFAAALFYSASDSAPSRKVTITVIAISLILLGGFLFTRFGNEDMDYMTNNELEGIHYLYNIAKPNSLFIESSLSTPWQFQGFEKYNYDTLTDILPDAVVTGDVNSVVRFVKQENHVGTYLIFARSEKAEATQELGDSPRIARSVRGCLAQIPAV